MRSVWKEGGGSAKQLLTWHRVGVVGQMLADKLGDHAVNAKGRSGGDEGCNDGHNKEDELEDEAHTGAWGLA